MTPEEYEQVKKMQTDFYQNPKTKREKKIMNTHKYKERAKKISIIKNKRKNNIRRKLRKNHKNLYKISGALKLFKK